jgi:hypothetical protein
MGKEVVLYDIHILLLALIFDLALGEPRTSWHPVGWMGKLISLLEGFAPKIKQALTEIAIDGYPDSEVRELKQGLAAKLGTTSNCKKLIEAIKESRGLICQVKV